MRNGIQLLFNVVEKGDYDQERHLPGYVSEFKLLLRQTERMEEHIAEFHKSFKFAKVSNIQKAFLGECLLNWPWRSSSKSVPVSRHSESIHTP